MRVPFWLKTLAATLATGVIASSALAQSTDELSFWVRASDAAFAEPMVKAWNAKHPNKVALTVIPNEDFVTKFGTASAGGASPDVVAIDLIFVPLFAQTGQLSDITAEANALPFAKSLSPAHVKLAKFGGKQYAVPFSGDSSFLLYNKTLFKKAGLDAEVPPKTLAELESAARKITALGGGVKGFYFSGACGGCNIFAMTPYVWASGGDVLSADGKQETLDSPAMRATLGAYRRMWEEKMIPRGAKTDTGTSFISPFFSSKIGMVSSGSFAIGLLKRDHPEIDFGVAAFPGAQGSASSFAGGDSIAIPVASKHKKEAWEFISWTLSEEVQVEQFARNGSVPVRADLADNAYSKQDSRFALASKLMQDGRTPYALRFNQLFNDPNGPWLAMIQEAIFGKGVDQAIKDAQPKFKKILAMP